MVLDAWVTAVTALGGRPEVARQAGEELLGRYREEHRRYHDLTHIEAVLRDSAWLGAELGLSEVDRAVLAVAAAAHDVIYDGVPGEDERRSAEWVRRRLGEAGVAEEHQEPTERLVLATIDHLGADPLTLALLDADLAVLGGTEAEYDRYARAVRAEYAHVSDADWLVGRGAVLARLIARDPLYRTAPARERWEAAAKANLKREKHSFGG
ncbi:HD domain-containing protein [Crossiella cryophila]|uniref:Putative metal-dependent HD superfamily phosphohydrolase n=1 Tax=Crossiella cryophila TaxID=43355 RepID=A0A7W7FZ48_9PSEU|nr:HD domain-containing protein [Crossiella cryophila]MBB4680784.1 putative metal-dependent HD superfamily phosphohydrolase [Crossiella cryophila]